MPANLDWLFPPASDSDWAPKPGPVTKRLIAEIERPVLEVHRRDLEWFRRHPGKRVQVRKRIEAEFTPFEAFLRPFRLVRVELLPNNVTSTAPIYPVDAAGLIEDVDD
jgi:hypothetical protein